MSMLILDAPDHDNAISGNEPSFYICMLKSIALVLQTYIKYYHDILHLSISLFGQSFC